MDELKKLLDDQKKAFEEFKKLNDERIAEIQKKGSADAALVASVEKANAHITKLQERLDEAEKAAKRPALGGAADEKNADKVAHAKGFEGYARKGIEVGLKDLERKAVNITTDAEGAFAIPEDLQRTILEVAQQATPMLGLVQVENGLNETYEQLFNVGGAVSGWVGETDARTATAAAQLRSVKPVFGEIYAMPGSTQRALNDLMFDVPAWLGREVGRSFAKEYDKMIVLGDGTNKGKGLLSSAITFAATADATRAFGQVERVNSGSSGDFDADDLLDLIYATNPEYHANARYLMHVTTIAKVRKFKDKNDNYLWQPSIQAGQPVTIHGFPVTSDGNIPVVAADALAVAFGDFKRAYTVVNVGAPVMIRDDVTVKGQVLFYTSRRIGGNVFDSNAYKVLKLAA